MMEFIKETAIPQGGRGRHKFKLKTIPPLSSHHKSRPRSKFQSTDKDSCSPSYRLTPLNSSSAPRPNAAYSSVSTDPNRTSQLKQPMCCFYERCVIPTHTEFLNSFTKHYNRERIIKHKPSIVAVAAGLTENFSYQNFTVQILKS